MKTTTAEKFHGRTSVQVKNQWLSIKAVIEENQPAINEVKGGAQDLPHPAKPWGSQHKQRGANLPTSHKSKKSGIPRKCKQHQQQLAPKTTTWNQQKRQKKCK
jgi:hypothetical protein